MTKRGPRFYKKIPADWSRFLRQVEHRLRVASLTAGAFQVREAKAVALVLTVAYPSPGFSPNALPFDTLHPSAFDQPIENARGYDETRPAVL